METINEEKTIGGGEIPDIKTEYKIEILWLLIYKKPKMHIFFLGIQNKNRYIPRDRA